MTNTNTTTTENVSENTVSADESKRFKFNTLEDAVALYLDAKKGREGILAELVQQEQLMSDICKQLAEDFTPAEGQLILDLGDGAPRGSIVVKRDDLYFIRGRNTGRPKGSKGKKSKDSENVADAEAAVAEAGVSESVTEVVAADVEKVEQAVAQGETKPTTILPPADVNALVEAANALAKAAPAIQHALEMHARQSEAPAAQTSAAE
jgi:hypothetical protein